MTHISSEFLLTHIYQKISSDTADEMIQKLHNALHKNESVWVSFVYFAALEMSGWYTNTPEFMYQIALQKTDIILADGIAFRLLHYAFFHPEIPRWKLLLYYRNYSKLAVENLNGTDFIPKLLQSFHGQNINLALYGTTSETLPKALAFAREQFGLSSVVGSHGYAPFPMELLQGDAPTILLVGLGTPRQEMWILEHLDILKKRGNILVFGVGGLFDFWGGREKRAPVIFRKLGMEWLWRLMSFPRKNFQKALSSFNFFGYLFTR